jgi:hypothetical protein
MLVVSEAAALGAGAGPLRRPAAAVEVLATSTSARAGADRSSPAPVPVGRPTQWLPGELRDEGRDDRLVARTFLRIRWPLTSGCAAAEPAGKAFGGHLESGIGSGRPRSRCAPRATKLTLGPCIERTASRVLADTTICPPWPSAVIREVALTSTPT